MDLVAMMALAEMGGEARNLTDLMAPASDVLVLLVGSLGNQQVTREMDSWGSLHVSVEEQASETDPSYSSASHHKAFGNLDWGSDCQDGRMERQGEFCLGFPFDRLMLQNLE
ncbi:unnamed protein product [Urochloa humidicola]